MLTRQPRLGAPLAAQQEGFGAQGAPDRKTRPNNLGDERRGHARADRHRRRRHIDQGLPVNPLQAAK